MRYAILMLALTGCPKTEEAAVAPASRSPQIGANLPQDATSKGYIGNLVDTPFRNYRPVEGAVTLNYESFRFRPDGSWSASGAISILEDKMECEESGSWTMDPATSETDGVVSWTVNDTDCASRKTQVTTRARIQLLDGGQYKFHFR
jgi:hypothetical protein